MSANKNIQMKQYNGTDYDNLYPTPSSHNHDASAITSGTLSIARGGTGAADAAGARANLGACANALEPATAAALGLTGDPTVDDGLSSLAANSWRKIKTVAVNIKNGSIVLIAAGDLNFSEIDEFLIEVKDMTVTVVCTKAGTAGYVYLWGQEMLALSFDHTGTFVLPVNFVYHAARTNSHVYLQQTSASYSFGINGESSNVTVGSDKKNTSTISMSASIREGYTSSVAVTGTANIYVRKAV